MGTAGKYPLAAILVVDDQRAVRRSVQLLLSDAGYRVFEAEDGAEALEVLNTRGPVQLVMTDVVMPQVDGVALVEILRREYPTQRVLYMSAYPAQILVQYRAPDLTIPFLAKPFTRVQLLAKVEQALAAPAPAAQRD